MSRVKTLSKAEEVFMAQHSNGTALHFESEKLTVCEVGNVGALGKLVCLRFLEWAMENPQGVIALPTGRTPEMFIAYLMHYRKTWNDAKTQAELALYGLNQPFFPDTTQLRFVQLDEFFPINPSHKNSFTHYIRTLYFPLLNLKPENILDMDFVKAEVFSSLTQEKEDLSSLFAKGVSPLDILHRDPCDEREVKQREVLEKAMAFAEEYEARVREWGGIGFFLGGIGPDGHIAFNMPGSAHDSKTRLVSLNYPTAAAASGDLGGIEYSRNKAAMTIGLGTITYNANATIIIMAAGEGKARMTAAAIEKAPAEEYPGTALHSSKGARFYLSHGAASLLEERRTARFHRKLTQGEATEDDVDAVLIDVALALSKRLVDLTEADIQSHPRACHLLLDHSHSYCKGEKAAAAQPLSLANMLEATASRLKAKVQHGVMLAANQRILHTAPHHDDIMLSYHAALPDLMDTNVHSFTYLTSGFHSVTNGYMLFTLSRANNDQFIRTNHDYIFQEPYANVITASVQAHQASSCKRPNRERELKIESILCCRNIVSIWGLETSEGLSRRVEWLMDFFERQLPGDKMPGKVQILKGAMRETEADRMWALRGVAPSQISHLRSAFYTDDFFTPLPTIEDDAMPVVRLIRDFNPSIVTVAFDPEGTGPDTHYKVLQVVAQAIRMMAASDEEGRNFAPTVWGYRNVWFQFHPAEATVMTAVDDEGLAAMNDAFLTCFSTQKAASFPAPDHDGPFSEWSEISQRRQRQELGILLGEDFFSTHPDAKVRASTGYVYLKEMNFHQFIGSAAQLKGRIEV